MPYTTIYSADGAGTYADWTDFPVGLFAQLSDYVDLGDSLGDAQYIWSATPGQAATFRVRANSPDSWPRPMRVDAVRVVAWVRTTGVSATCSFRVRILGQDYDSDVYTVTSAAYTEISWLLPTLPDGNGWNITRLWTNYSGFEMGLVFLGGDELRCSKFHAYAMDEPYPQWTVVPTAAGTQADWLSYPVASIPWTTLQRYDGDESYCYSTVGGEISVFPHDAMGLPFPAVIDKVRVALLVKNTSATAQTITPLLRLAGVDYRGGCDTLGTVVPPDSVWHLVHAEFSTDPSLAWPCGNPAGGPWTQAQINAAEIGFENTSGGAFRITSLAMEIFLTPAGSSVIDWYPTANGFHQDFPPVAPNAGEAAWEDVDEDPPDDAVSYIEASATTSGTPQYCSFVMGLSAGAISLAMGEKNTVVARSDGSVWTWGSNIQGQLGNDTLGSSAIAVQVLDAPGTGFLSDVAKVVAGRYFVVALKNDGTVWTWGKNNVGQLGDNTVVTPKRRPVQVVGPGGVGFLVGIVDIAAGVDHASAVKNDGTVWCWGANTQGQIGDNTFAGPRIVPVQVVGPGGAGFLADIDKIACGNFHTIALDTLLNVWCWGRNDHGQLGFNAVLPNKLEFPVQVVGLGGVGFLTDVVSITGGALHTGAVKSDGTVWCWGADSVGQTGCNVPGLDKPAPVQVVGPGGVGVFADAATVSAGGYHTLTLKTDGTVWGWGYNTAGVLGDGTTTSPRATPVQALGITTGAYLINSMSGDATSAADASGVILTSLVPWCWGNNSVAQLGRGTSSVAESTPAQVTVITGSTATGERIYLVELTARVRLGNLPHSTAEIVPVLRETVANIPVFGTPITIEGTGGTWFDVKWNYYDCPFSGRWEWATSDTYDVHQYEYGVGVLQGDVLVSRVRARIITCPDYPAAGAPDPIDMRITNGANAMMIRSILDGTLYAVTEFAVGVGGYDPAAPGTVVAVNPADVMLTTEIWRGPLTHVQYSADAPPWNVWYYCRVPRNTAIQGIGEVGLYAEILWSPFVWEIGTSFLFAKQHMPLQTRHEDTVGVYVFQVRYT